VADACIPEDKTQVFHDQIEVKQRELQPWTAKINTKQAEVDVATSERDALAKKAEAVKRAGKEAQNALEKLQADLEAKVRRGRGLSVSADECLSVFGTWRAEKRQSKLTEGCQEWREETAGEAGATPIDLSNINLA
jgi:chromosome segregation ATPase